MLVYPTFAQWVQAVVLPLQQSNPTWHLLDGWDTGSNREIVGRFRYENQIWAVHGDTRFKPVIAAYHAIIAEEDMVPFDMKLAKVNHCLTLKPEIWNTDLPKHFYVYSQAG